MKDKWKENWAVVEQLGAGGQGTTFLVKRKKTDEVGVLKVLKKQSSEQARRRMYKEVANLRLLHSASCKVPGILASSTDSFEDPSEELYFVMEYIEGECLNEVVGKSGGLSLEMSVAIAKDLCATMRKAHDEQVIHRDLKPENIVVRSKDPTDVVIVDYGLSFNEADEESVTRDSETIDNRFMSLPERRVPQGDRRDSRSDVTGVCAVLYYCIVGQPPVDLVDAKGLPPHRRVGLSVAEKLGDDRRLYDVESLLDRGFAAQIDLRFQSVDELSERLDSVLSPKTRTTTVNPFEIARESADLFLKHDRTTQLAEYQKNSEGIMAAIQTVVKRHDKPELKPFALSTPGFNEKMFGGPQEGEWLRLAACVQISLHRHAHRFLVAYSVFARGTQCGVFRRIFTNDGASPNWIGMSNWEDVLWFDGLSKPSVNAIQDDVTYYIVEGQRYLQSKTLGNA